MTGAPTGQHRTREFALRLEHQLADVLLEFVEAQLEYARRMTRHAVGEQPAGSSETTIAGLERAAEAFRHVLAR